MVSRGFTSREFASRPPLAFKFANLSDTMSACALPFSLQGFPAFVGHTSSYCCARNFDIVESLIFFTFLSCRIFTHWAHTYSFFDSICHIFANNGHHLLGLSSKVFTFDHLLTYIVQTSFTVYQFLRLNSQKTVKTDS